MLEIRLSRQNRGRHSHPAPVYLSGIPRIVAPTSREPRLGLPARIPRAFLLAAGNVARNFLILRRHRRSVSDRRDVIIDINGYFAPPGGPGALHFYPVTPYTARGYSLNMTVVTPGPLIYLTTWPQGLPQPLVSTLNSFRGDGGQRGPGAGRARRRHQCIRARCDRPDHRHQRVLRAVMGVCGSRCKT